MSIGVLPVFTGASVIFPAPPLPLLPDHVNVVLPTLDTGAIFNAAPEQLLYVPVATDVPTGIGLTVTVLVIGVPAQPLALGVMI
jgi:hypothetical protein